jgi:hypothetical protein
MPPVANSGQANAIATGASPTPVPSAAVTSNYRQNAAQSASWIAASTQLPDGAIRDSSTHISPYFANRAAIGMVLAGGHTAAVQSWMSWYLAHLNLTDMWGTSGTIYDYSVNAQGTESSLNQADSTDAYAATFLSLANAFYNSGDPTAQAYVISVRPQLDAVASVILSGQQSDGLTWARPDYHIKYLMDNVEVYAGLRDYASLLSRAFGDDANSRAVSSRAAQVASGLESEMWNAGGNQYYNYVGEAGFKSPTDWTNYYSSASELFPVLYGLISPSSARAQSLYAQFNSAFSAWAQLEKPDKYPWALVSTVAALMSDTGRASAYVANVDSQYASRGFPYPWYDAEAGWFVQTNTLLASSVTASGRSRR